MSKLIAIEGIDASGKATQTKLLASKLGGAVMSFPDYDSITGGLIKAYLGEEWETVTTKVSQLDPNKLDGMLFQCLQALNRYEVADEIRARAATAPLVFDRYTASGFVYGSEDKVPMDWMRAVHSSLPQPDLWILVDVPVEASFARRPERRDRNETNRPLLERVRVGYLRLFEEMQSKRLPWHVVSGMGTTDEVHARIMGVVERL